MGRDPLCPYLDGSDHSDCRTYANLATARREGEAKGRREARDLSPFGLILGWIAFGFLLGWTLAGLYFWIARGAS